MQNILSTKDTNLFRQSPPQEELVTHTSHQVESKLNEAEALLMVVSTVIGELKQPMTVILGVNELLLTKIDEDNPVLTDLTIIGKQIRRMKETIEGLDAITEYNTTR